MEKQDMHLENKMSKFKPDVYTLDLQFQLQVHGDSDVSIRAIACKSIRKKI